MEYKTFPELVEAYGGPAKFRCLIKFNYVDAEFASAPEYDDVWLRCMISRIPGPSFQVERQLDIDYINLSSFMYYVPDFNGKCSMGICSSEQIVHFEYNSFETFLRDVENGKILILDESVDDSDGLRTLCITKKKWFEPLSKLAYLVHEADFVVSCGEVDTTVIHPINHRRNSSHYKNIY